MEGRSDAKVLIDSDTSQITWIAFSTPWEAIRWIEMMRIYQSLSSHLILREREREKLHSVSDNLHSIDSHPQLCGHQTGHRLTIEREKNLQTFICLWQLFG